MELFGNSERSDVAKYKADNDSVIHVNYNYIDDASALVQNFNGQTMQTALAKLNKNCNAPSNPAAATVRGADRRFYPNITLYIRKKICICTSHASCRNNGANV